MIIVTGATGRLGGLVVEQLLNRTPADRIGVSVRDPGKAESLAQRGVRVRQGDFDDPAGLAEAFDGASRVLVVSASALGDVAVRWNRNAIEAARAAGAERIFYTSHVGVAEASPFPPMPTHAASEAALRETGIGTALRNGFYAQTLPMLVGDALETGAIMAPEDGPVSWTTHADLAEATAAVLTDDAFGGDVLNLTGAQAVDLDAVAAILSERVGRTIRRTVVADDDYRAALIGRGVPELGADMTVGIFRAAREGRFALVDPALARLVDRLPASVAEMLAP